jgi:hypothetical protein
MDWVESAVVQQHQQQLERKKKCGRERKTKGGGVNHVYPAAFFLF